MLERADIEHPVRARPGAEGARLVRLRLAPPRRGAGAERPGLRDEGRRRRRRPAGGRGRRAHAASADGRPRPAGRILPRAAAAPVPRRGPARGAKGWACAAPTATSTSTLHAGEILGIAGVIGSGREELSRTLAGFAPHDAGTLTIHGQEVRAGLPGRRGRPRHRLCPARAAHRGPGAVPAGRRQHHAGEPGRAAPVRPDRHRAPSAGSPASGSSGCASARPASTRCASTCRAATSRRWCSPSG